MVQAHLWEKSDIWLMVRCCIPSLLLPAGSASPAPAQSRCGLIRPASELGIMAVQCAPPARAYTTKLPCRALQSNTIALRGVAAVGFLIVVASVIYGFVLLICKTAFAPAPRLPRQRRHGPAHAHAYAHEAASAEIPLHAEDAASVHSSQRYGA
jgi:hypothetical protein